MYLQDRRKNRDRRIFKLIVYHAKPVISPENEWKMNFATPVKRRLSPWESSRLTPGLLFIPIIPPDIRLLPSVIIP
jgi:hypothetical protein